MTTMEAGIAERVRIARLKVVEASADVTIAKTRLCDAERVYDAARAEHYAAKRALLEAAGEPPIEADYLGDWYVAPSSSSPKPRRWFAVWLNK